MSAADLVLDGMLGVGARGELRGEPLVAAATVGRAGVPVLAVDVPSGVDADTGAAGVAVRADVTVTFGTLKPGLVVGRGAELAGLVEVADIGLGWEPDHDPVVAVLDLVDVRALLPVPLGESSKYSRGVVGLIAGGAHYTGAAVLAAGGAVRAGAGTVRLHSVAKPADAVRAAWPEVVAVVHEAGEHGSVRGGSDVTGDQKVDAWVVGPGLGTDADAAAVVRAVLADDRPVLLDADALTLVGRDLDLLRGRDAPTLVTPHTGEFERLTGIARVGAERDRIGCARQAAADLGVTVLLKGLTTVVAAPDGRVRVNPTGTPWLATAGTGDVLSGAAGALLAAGLDPLDAGAVAAWVHGLAGRLAAGGPATGPAAGSAGRGAPGAPGAPISAGDVVAHWSDAVRRITAPTG